MLGHAIRLLSSKRLLQIRNFSSPPASTYKETKVRVLDVDINYVETLGHNANAPCIFFLPGAFGSIEMDFLPIIPQLGKEKYKWIAWDPPGFGKSRPPIRHAFSKLSPPIADAPYARELMHVLGHDSYTVLAWSAAGLTAMLVAAEEPEKVPALITWAAFGTMEKKEEQNAKQAKKFGLAAIHEDRRKSLVNSCGEELLLEMWNAWSDEIVRMVKSGVYKTNGSFQKVIQSVQCPTLLLHGRKDALISVSDAEYLNANIKNSRLHLFEKGTHNLHLRNTAEFVKCIEDFVDENVVRAK